MSSSYQITASGYIETFIDSQGRTMHKYKGGSIASSDLQVTVSGCNITSHPGSQNIKINTFEDSDHLLVSKELYVEQLNLVRQYRILEESYLEQETAMAQAHFYTLSILKRLLYSVYKQQITEMSLGFESSEVNFPVEESRKLIDAKFPPYTNLSIHDFCSCLEQEEREKVVID